MEATSKVNSNSNSNSNSITDTNMNVNQLNDDADSVFSGSTVKASNANKVGRVESLNHFVVHGALRHLRGRLRLCTLL
jgi:hypothetical protein